MKILWTRRQEAAYFQEIFDQGCRAAFDFPEAARAGLVSRGKLEANGNDHGPCRLCKQVKE